MAFVILYEPNAFLLRVTQKPWVEAFSPEIPNPTETLPKTQTTSVTTKGLCVELVQEDHQSGITKTQKWIMLIVQNPLITFI